MYIIFKAASANSIAVTAFEIFQPKSFWTAWDENLISDEPEGKLWTMMPF
jgi:hypothetical protein